MRNHNNNNNDNTNDGSAGDIHTPNSHHKIQVFSDPTLGKS